jgi:hypothetical protein
VLLKQHPQQGIPVYVQLDKLLIVNRVAVGLLRRVLCRESRCEKAEIRDEER